MRRSWGLLVVVSLLLSKRAIAQDLEGGPTDDRLAPETSDTRQTTTQTGLREVDETPSRAHDDTKRQLEPRGAPFGAPGQIAISGGTTIRASSLSYQSGASVKHASFDPSFFFFPVSHVAVGLAVQLYGDDSTLFDAGGNEFETKTLAFFAGPSLGYDIAFSRYVSLFPNASLGFGFVKASEQVVKPAPGAAVSGGLHENTEADAFVNVAVPLLFHPVQHFSFGVGPTFNHDFAKTEGDPDIGTQVTAIGGGFFMIGHWGGDLPPEDEHAAPPRKWTSHVGTDHTCVLANDLSLGGGWTSLPASHSTEANFSAGGSFGCFVGHGFSLGAGSQLSVGHYSGKYATTGQSFSTNSDGVSLSGIVGYAVSFGSGFVLYPRASFFLGEDDLSIKSGGSTNSTSEGFATVELFAPIDYEIAEHFFFGIGPFIESDLERSEPDNSQNRRTTIGAASEIGTWL